MTDMRLGIVAEVVDKATQKLQKIWNVQQKLQAQSKALAASGVQSITAGARKAGKGLAIMGAAATIAYGGATVAAERLVGTASQFERFQTVLEQTEGSSDKAKAAMGWVTDFAVKTPYELDTVMGSFVKLRSYGIDPTNGTLKTLGDTAAAMDKPLNQAVEALADAVTGENERLKEFGITASKAHGKITYEYTNAAGEIERRTVDAGNRLKIQATLMEVWGAKYGGAMEKLSATWAGMVSNVADIWQKFQLMIMQSGLFDWMKGKLKSVLDQLSAWEADGTMQRIAERIGQMIQTALTQLWTAGVAVWQMIRNIGAALQWAAGFLGGWDRLAMVLAAIAFAPQLMATAQGLMMIARGIALLGAAAMINPITLLVAALAAIAAAAYFLVDDWGPVLDWFGAQWEAIKDWATGAWEGVKTAWDSAVTWFAGLWPSITASAAKIWDGIASAAASAWAGVRSAWSGALAWFGNLWSGLVKSDVFAGLTSAASSAWEGLKSVWVAAPGWFSAIWSEISASAPGAWDKAKQVAWDYWSFLKSQWAANLEALSGAFAPFTEGVGARFAAMWDRLQASGSKLISVFQRIGNVVAPALQRLGQAFSGDGGGLSKGYALLGKIAGLTFDALVSSLEIAVGLIESVINGLDQFTGWLIDGKAIDWSVLMPDIDLGGAVKRLMDGAVTAAKIAWEAMKALFGWTPLGLIFNNWGAIKGAVASAIDGAVSAAKTSWSGIQALFTDWVPDFGTWKLPTLDTAALKTAWETVKSWFSWVPTFPGWKLPALDTAAFEAAFNAISGVVQRVWDTIGPIFEKIVSAAGDLGKAVGDAVGKAVEGAKAAMDYLSGPQGAERIIQQMSGIAENGWRGDFVQGQARRHCPVRVQGQPLHREARPAAA